MSQVSRIGEAESAARPSAATRVPQKKGKGGFFTTLEPAFVAALACFVPSALSSGNRSKVSPYFRFRMILAPFLL